MLSKADGAIDFTQPADKVAARIRGVDPWPGAQAKLRDQVVKLFRARATSQVGATEAAPGTVVSVDATGLHVATGGGGIVVIQEIQASGRKRLTASQFAAGRGVAVGDVLAKPEIA